jgi:hypothetical protein
MAGTNYYVLVATQAEQNQAGTTPAADTHIVAVAQGSALDTQLAGNYAGLVNAGGVAGYLRAGPFTTQAAAQAYLGTGAQTTTTPVPGVGIAPAGGLVPVNPISGLNQFFTEVEGFFKFTEKVVEDLVDPKFWASLGWLFLGLILTISGLVMWLKHEGVSMPHLPKVVPLPV